MDYKTLKWTVHDNPLRPGEPCIGVITLNRPDQLNAVDPLMRLELDAPVQRDRPQFRPQGGDPYG